MIDEECKSVLSKLSKKIIYLIDNEKNYGDEYTAIVLEDLKDEFNLTKYI